ncbi:hypothetical protein N836_11095 [Leptolyngbya sp. Heron Island J]|nr:hypothetical protein N836_11095 [Leptolyngbya sp. Heron Island J]
MLSAEAFHGTPVEQKIDSNGILIPWLLGESNKLPNQVVAIAA